MLSITGYILSLALLLLGFKKPGFSFLGAILLTILSINENVLNHENAIVLITVWVYTFILIYSRFKG